MAINIISKTYEEYKERNENKRMANGTLKKLIENVKLQHIPHIDIKPETIRGRMRQNRKTVSYHRGPESLMLNFEDNLVLV